MLVFFRAFFRVFSENYIMSEKVFLRKFVEIGNESDIKSGSLIDICTNDLPI
jgi:hypothetical protein